MMNDVPFPSTGQQQNERAGRWRSRRHQTQGRPTEESAPPHCAATFRQRHTALHCTHVTPAKYNYYYLLYLWDTPTLIITNEAVTWRLTFNQLIIHKFLKIGWNMWRTSQERYEKIGIKVMQKKRGNIHCRTYHIFKYLL